MGSGSLRKRTRAAVTLLEQGPDLRRARGEERRRRRDARLPAQEWDEEQIIEDLLRAVDEP
jgi:hypothetical protein